MGHIKRTLLLCALLLLPSVAGATPFSASVSLDLTTLTFRGVPVSQSYVLYTDPRDPSRGLNEVESRDTFLAGSARPVTPYTERFAYIPSLTRSEGPMTLSLPGVGTVTAFGGPTGVSSTIMLLTSGQARSASVQDSLLTALETGPLTVTVDFTIAHSAPHLGDPDFFSGGGVGLVIGRFEDPNQAVHIEGFSLGLGRDVFGRSGTLSVTYPFQKGQSTLFEVFTSTKVSVPEPESVLLLGGGLLGLWAWRRRQATP